MKNVTKSVQVLSKVVDLLLGSNYATSAEQSLYQIKTRQL
jgi:hypothetical protein